MISVGVPQVVKHKKVVRDPSEGWTKPRLIMLCKTRLQKQAGRAKYSSKTNTHDPNALKESRSLQNRIAARSIRGWYASTDNKLQMQRNTKKHLWEKRPASRNKAIEYWRPRKQIATR